LEVDSDDNETEEHHTKSSKKQKRKESVTHPSLLTTTTTSVQPSIQNSTLTQSPTESSTSVTLTISRSSLLLDYTPEYTAKRARQLLKLSMRILRYGDPAEIVDANFSRNDTIYQGETWVQEQSSLNTYYRSYLRSDFRKKIVLVRQFAKLPFEEGEHKKNLKANYWKILKPLGQHWQNEYHKLGYYCNDEAISNYINIPIDGITDNFRLFISFMLVMPENKLKAKDDLQKYDILTQNDSLTPAEAKNFSKNLDTNVVEVFSSPENSDTGEKI